MKRFGFDKEERKEILIEIKKQYLLKCREIFILMDLVF